LTKAVELHATTKTNALPTADASHAARAPLAPQTERSEEELNAYLSELIHRAPVMVFIKGTPSAPRCGFTRQLIQLLDSENIKYDYFDILTDEQVRQGKFV
jgi:hypothetical protein